MFSGYKTYSAAIGLICLGIYELTQGNYDAGLARIGEGVGLLGLRHAVSKGE